METLAARDDIKSLFSNKMFCYLLVKDPLYKQLFKRLRRETEDFTKEGFIQIGTIDIIYAKNYENCENALLDHINLLIVIEFTQDFDFEFLKKRGFVLCLENYQISLRKI